MINAQSLVKDKLVYTLNQDDKTAILIGSKSVDYEIFIPRMIEHESQEYIITSIGELCFRDSKIKTVMFDPNSNILTFDKYSFAWSTIETIYIPSHLTRICDGAFYFCRMLSRIEIPIDSQLQTIERSVFVESSIECFTIPSNLLELNDGWCAETPKLRKMTVHPGNKRFMNLNDEMIIGKSDIKSDKYDTIFFVCRDIKHIKIPSFIKTIASFSFSESQIETIEIPLHLTKICENAFASCQNLRHITIPIDSQLETIEKAAFAGSSIESIFIPHHITTICEGTFSCCEQLQWIDFHDDSQLRVIENYAFTESMIYSFQLPPHVTKFMRSVFSECFDLKVIEIDEKSELEVGDKKLYHHNNFFENYIIMVPVDIWNKLQ